MNLFSPRRSSAYAPCTAGSASPKRCPPSYVPTCCAAPSATRAHGAGERLRVDEPPRAASALRAHSVARARLGLEGRWQKRKVSFDGCAGSNKTLPLPQPVRDAIALRPSCVAVFLHYAFPPPDYEGAKRRALAF